MTQVILDDERGTASTIILFPLFAALVFVFVQAALWQRDRQLADAAADRTSVAVALYGSDAAAARSEAVTRLEQSGMSDIDVEIDRNRDAVIVNLSATAPGMLVGTSSTLTAHSMTPIEGFRAP